MNNEYYLNFRNNLQHQLKDRGYNEMFADKQLNRWTNYLKMNN